MAGKNLEEVYERIMTGVGPSFQGRQRERVCCPECAVDLVAGLLEEYHQYQHGTGSPPQW